jgi:hypothetical protein
LGESFRNSAATPIANIVVLSTRQKILLSECLDRLSNRLMEIVGEALKFHKQRVLNRETCGRQQDLRKSARDRQEGHRSATPSRCSLGLRPILFMTPVRPLGCS